MENLPEILNIESMSAREVNRLTGFDQEESALMIPSLRINYDDEDDQGNKIPRGEWLLSSEGTTNNVSRITRFLTSDDIFRPELILWL